MDCSDDSSRESDQVIDDFDIDLSESSFVFDPLALAANGNADAGWARQPAYRPEDW